eukprot:6448290-Pyramimonas_sp.AAC.1
MARLEADSAGFDIQLPASYPDLISRPASWHLPSGAAVAAAESSDAPCTTAMRPTSGANAQPWTLG